MGGFDEAPCSLTSRCCWGPTVYESFESGECACSSVEVWAMAMAQTKIGTDGVKNEGFSDEGNLETISDVNGSVGRGKWVIPGGRPTAKPPEAAPLRPVTNCQDRHLSVK